MSVTSPRPARSSAVPAAWAILIGAGATSITYNVTHAVNGGALNVGLALLYGIAPVYVSALLSHVVAVHGGGKFMQAITFVLMLGAMGLSIGATAAVVQPAAGTWMQWLFGVVIDGAALVALRVILDSRNRKAAAETELDIARAEATAAGERAAEAVGERSRLETELAEVRAELEAARRLVPPRNLRRTSGRKSARTPARNQSRTSGPEVTPEASPVPGGSSAPEDVPDLDTEARILALIDQGHSASQAGIMAGKSDSYGRQVARLARAARQEPAGDERTEGDAI